MRTGAELDAAEEARQKRIADAWSDGDPAEADRQSAISKRMAGELKAKAKENDRKQRELYEEGRRSARDELKAKDSDKAKAKATRERDAANKRRTQSLKRRGKTIAKHPVAQVHNGSVTGLLAGSLGLVLLYQFLKSSDKVPGFLSGISVGIRWLADPNGVIPYKKGN